MTHDELEQAGFLHADYVPDGTNYRRGELYVRMTPTGSLRVFLPNGSDGSDIELSSGDVYNPDILYRGPIKDIDELIRLTHRWVA
ncbi:hypothetical protein [Solirubrum puertoriconensis]|uniref:Uncharacterized protein n=1 Tax=Solirubrum puertoriconensis TaxID=1751427 RepID=A0A9X0HMX9_SOLP1|nr:hypothetical protein [Solirubrum puertoriconensis]KUG08846.1 hypothetical protein ASU33_12020 [Solirubrum puertoriconensis]